MKLRELDLERDVKVCDKEIFSILHKHKFRNLREMLDHTELLSDDELYNVKNKMESKLSKLEQLLDIELTRKYGRD